jgi:hypothetical protein
MGNTFSHLYLIIFYLLSNDCIHLNREHGNKCENEGLLVFYNLQNSIYVYNIKQTRQDKRFENKLNNFILNSFVTVTRKPSGMLIFKRKNEN